MADTPQIPAGWYPDPRQQGQERYWNGSAWTVAVRAIEVPLTQASVDADRARIANSLEQAARAAEADLGILRGGRRGSGDGDTISIEEAAAERADLGSAATRAARQAAAELEETGGVRRVRGARETADALADRGRLARAADRAALDATEDVLAAQGVAAARPARAEQVEEAQPAELTPRQRRRLLRAEQAKAAAERTQGEIAINEEEPLPPKTNRRALRKALKAQQEAAAAQTSGAVASDAPSAGSGRAERRALRKQLDEQARAARQTQTPVVPTVSANPSAPVSAAAELKAQAAAAKAAERAERRALKDAERAARAAERAEAKAEKQRLKDIRRNAEARLATPQEAKQPKRPTTSTRDLIDAAAESATANERALRRDEKAAQKAQRKASKGSAVRAPKAPRADKSPRKPLFSRKNRNVTLPTSGNSIPVNPRGINNRRLKTAAGNGAVVPIGLDAVQAAAEEQILNDRKNTAAVQKTATPGAGAPRDDAPRVSLTGRVRNLFARRPQIDPADEAAARLLANAPKRPNTGLTGRQDMIAAPAEQPKPLTAIERAAADALAQGDGYVSVQDVDPKAQKRKRFTIIIVAAVLAIAATVTTVVLVNQPAKDPTTSSQNGNSEDPNNSGNGSNNSGNGSNTNPGGTTVDPNPSPTGNLNVPVPSQLAKSLESKIAAAVNQNVKRDVAPVLTQWIGQDGSLQIFIALSDGNGTSASVADAAVKATAETINALRGQNFTGMRFITVYATVEVASRKMPDGSTKTYDGPISRIDIPASALKGGPYSASDIKGISTRYVVNQGIL